MTTLTPAYVDAEGLLRGWLNSLTGAGGLVGQGNPLALGAHLRRLRSPFRDAYAVLTAIGTPAAMTAERVTCHARISASVYGISKDNAARAAVAYANNLLQIPVTHPVYSGVQFHTIDAITGPIYIPDGDEERYLVDADFHMTASQSVNTTGGPGGGIVVQTTTTLYQNTPSALWSFPNPFNRSCLVEVFIGDVQWFADVQVTNSLITVTFPSPVSGRITVT